MAATPSDASTRNQDYCLVVWQKSGSVATYLLKTHPCIKYKDGIFRVVSDEVEIVYSVEHVRKFTLNDADDLDDGIETLAESDEQPHSFSLDKARPGSIVSIYEANGRNLGTYTVGADGQMRYSLDNYPAGIYLIKSESTTIKIIKK